MKKSDSEILQSQKRMRSGDHTMDRVLGMSQRLLKQNKNKLNQKNLINELRRSATAVGGESGSRSNPHQQPHSPRRSHHQEEKESSDLSTHEPTNRLHPNLYR
jgi:hypothetical protein